MVFYYKQNIHELASLFSFPASGVLSFLEKWLRRERAKLIAVTFEELEDEWLSELFAGKSKRTYVNKILLKLNFYWYSWSCTEI